MGFFEVLAEDEAVFLDVNTPILSNEKTHNQGLTIITLVSLQREMLGLE